MKRQANPKEGTRSARSFATRGVSSGRSFAPLTSFARYRQTPEASVIPDFGCRYAGRKRYQMTTHRQREAHRCSVAKGHSGFRILKSVFAKQSHLTGNHLLIDPRCQCIRQS
jgi:hypothetical protein